MRVNNVVNEGSSCEISIDFSGPDGLPAVPASVVYRVDCATTGAAIRAATPISPAANVVIRITPDDTAIVNPASASERRRVTVVASYGAGDALTGEYEFAVRNVRFVG